MRFLRLFSNSLIAGAFGAAYLTILLLQLNPQVPLVSRTVWRWYATLGAFYGIHLAILFYVTMLLREFVSADIFSPGWISVRLLAWMSAVAAAVAATLMWLNLNGFPTLFDEAETRRFVFGAAATTASAIVLLGIAVAHYSFGRRGSRVGAGLLVLAITGSLALPIAARGAGGALPLGARRVMLAPAPARETPHVTLILLDGASLEYVWPRVAAGRLPNFGRMLDINSGASMDLATIRPTQPDPVWAAVATGMYPAKNGVRSAASYFGRGDDRPLDLLPDHCFSHILVRLGIVRDQPNSSAAWRARPLWAILSDYGISSGIVRWPLTYPAQPFSGFLVTDRFHQLIGSMIEPDERSIHPPDILPIARDAFAGSTGADRWDEFYRRAAREIMTGRPVQLEAIRYQELDAAGHFYLRYAQPRGFGDVADSDRQQNGAVLDRAYATIDGVIGAAIERQSPGDLLLVISGFGMQPVTPVKHLAARILRDPDVSGTHENAPDGFMLAYGTTVLAGRKPRASIVDVTPTILYFLGVPVGRDMDGFARADLFTPAFTAQRPVAFIPSHGR
ncbi:MAG TPA: alkaline phosphatase family protein [Vicinamibacterales bacterium]|nr:alkaline phosphatase family protein [Vicinamibacterales bacterium]